MTKGEIITFGLLATACLVAVVRVAASPRDSATAYLVRHCEEAQGEWLYGEEQPTCIRADGTWMIFDSQVHSFVPKPELALAAEPAPSFPAFSPAASAAPADFPGAGILTLTLAVLRILSCRE